MKSLLKSKFHSGSAKYHIISTLGLKLALFENFSRIDFRKNRMEIKSYRNRFFLVNKVSTEIVLRVYFSRIYWLYCRSTLIRYSLYLTQHTHLTMTRRWVVKGERWDVRGVASSSCHSHLSHDNQHMTQHLSRLTSHLSPLTSHLSPLTSHLNWIEAIYLFLSCLFPVMEFRRTKIELTTTTSRFRQVWKVKSEGNKWSVYQSREWDHKGDHERPSNHQQNIHFKNTITRLLVIKEISNIDQQ